MITRKQVMIRRRRLKVTIKDVIIKENSKNDINNTNNENN